MKRHLLVTTLALLALGLASSHAATKTWTGQSGGLWSTSANWSPSGAPANNDSLNFPLVAAGRVKTMTNDLAGRTFTDLTFTINGYTLRGIALTLTDGINAAQSTLGNVIEVTITLSGHQTFNVANGGGTLLLSGNLNLNRANLSFGGAGSVNISGIISNRGGVVIVGSNTVTFLGTASNRFDGTMWVQNGTLILNKVSGGVGQIAVPGDLIIGTTKPATVRLSENNQIAPDAAVTIHQDCVLDLDGQTNTVGSLLFHGGGTVQTGTGQLRLGGDVTVESGGGVATISGNLYLGNSERTFTVGDVASGLDLDIPAVISAGNSGAPFYFGVGFTKAGAGLMRLAGANTHGGLTVVNDGELHVSHNLALGADGGLLAGTRVNSNALLRLESVQVGNELLILNKAATNGHAVFNFGNSSWSGPVTLSADSRLWSGGTLVFSNALSGAGGLFLTGETFELTGTNANTYAGGTWVDCALLRLNGSQANGTIPGDLIAGANSPDDSNSVQFAKSQQIADIAKVTLHRRSVLDLNGRADWIDELEFVGGLAPQHGRVQTGAGYLGVQNRIGAGASSVGTIAGNLKLASATVFEVATNGNVNVPGSIQEGGFTLRGGGNLILQGINTFAGAVVVENGVLHADGNFALGAITTGTTVQPGGTLNLQPSVTSLNEPLTLSGTGMLGYVALEAHGNATLLNTVTLDGEVAVHVATNLVLTLQGVLGGTGNLTKHGAGTLVLSGSSGNTFKGDLYVAEGALHMNKAGAASIPHRLVVGGFGQTARAVNLDHSEVNEVTVRRHGSWDLNGYSDAILDLVLVDGGDVSAPGPGVLTLAAGCDVSVSFGLGVQGSSTLSGVVSLMDVHTFSVADQRIMVGDPVELNLSAAVRGSGSIVKTGSGNLSLSASNSFTGNLSVQGGQVHVAHNNALGTGVGGTLVLNSASLILEPGVAVLHETLTLNSTGLTDLPPLWSAGGTNHWTGLVGLQSNARIGVETNSALVLSGEISGVGNVTKEGTGTLILAGGGANTFAGDTWIREGDLHCQKVALARAIPGHLTIGTGSNTCTVLTLTDDQLAPTGDVTILKSCLLDLRDHDAEVGWLKLDAGRVETGAGRIEPRTGIAVLGWTYQESTLNGRLGLRGEIPVQIESDLRIEAAIDDILPGQPGGLLITGGWIGYEVNLTTSNAFTGRLRVEDVEVKVCHDNALGGPLGGVEVHSGWLSLCGVRVAREPLWLDGGELGFSQSNLWSGPITISAGSIAGGSSSSRLELTGAVSASGGVEFTGAGTVEFSGSASNHFESHVWVDDSLVMLLNRSIPDSALGGSVILRPGMLGGKQVVRNLRDDQVADETGMTIWEGTWDLNGHREKVRSLFLSVAQVSLGAGGSLELESATVYGSITGDGEIHLTGPDNSYFYGTNTHTGRTLVDNAFLFVKGSQPNSPIELHAGATLGGVGPVSHVRSTGGHVYPSLGWNPAPGWEWPPTLTTRDLTLDAASAASFRLKPGYLDQIQVLGAVNLGDAKFNLIVHSNQVSQPGERFVLVNNDGSDPVVGRFAGLPEGSQVASSLQRFALSYQGNDGNDVVLTCLGSTLTVVQAVITAGNGNGVVDTNECNLLTLVLSNSTPDTVAGLSVSLHPQTPGLVVTRVRNVFPDLAPGALATNLVPFQFSTLPGFAPGSTAGFLLTLEVAAHGQATSLLLLPTATPATVRDGGGVCETCPAQVIAGLLGTNSPLMAGTPTGLSVATACGSEGPWPAFTNLPARFQSYVLLNGESNACVRVSLQSDMPLHCLVYSNAFNPIQPALNNIAHLDAYASNQFPRSLSVTLAPHQMTLLVVHEPGDGLAVEANYRLELSGGNCHPALQISPLHPNRIRLEWTTSAVGYRLERSSSVALPPPWAPLSGAPGVTASRFVVTNALFGGQQFYLLHKP